MTSRWLLLPVFAVFLMGLFSTEIADPDFWWALKTGDCIFHTHSLPVPDPFAYTTATAHDTRDFNLSFEWLSQVIFYLVYRAGGFAGIVLFRAALLAAFCGIAGLVVYRRTGGFYRALAATALVAPVAAGFTADRSYLFTFLFLAITIAILEFRRALWVLPLLFVIWANCHGGFFLGWVTLAAYLGLRNRWLWISILASGLNPDGFRVIQVLLSFRNSFLTSKLLEWAPPSLWPPSAFSALLVAAAVVLVFSRRKVRASDWILFGAFALAALLAQRNTILIGFLAPILILSYLPQTLTFRAVTVRERLGPPLILALLIAALGFGLARGDFFQLRAAEWRYPAGAADFLLTHHITQPIFNTYEYGGYLIWKLYPQQRVFIDGRALSESVFMDYARILYNHDESGGKSAQQLLDQYGVQVIVMNAFEYSTGTAYVLAPALADPAQHNWTLVYTDPQSLIFMRHVPDGVQPIDSLRVFDHLEAACGLHIEREPKYTGCARSLGQIYAKAGDLTSERRWIGIYLAHPHPLDPEAERTYAQLVSSGH